MTKDLRKKQIVKNISFSLFAQIISLAVSLIMGLVVPKFIDEYQYAYWHTYLLYVSYVGVLHFGLLDGVVLRYSQYDYEDLDKRRLRSQFAVLLIISGIASFILVLFGSNSGGLTKTITYLVVCGIFTKNIFTYNTYLFQITNRINKYAFVVISQRLLYGVFALLLIFFNQHNFIWYCIADLAGDCVGILLSLFSNKDLHFGKLLPFKETVQETWLNVSSGIMLMLANWSSMLLVSCAKMIIEWKWGPLVFGKSSFAFSVSNLILAFMTAISVVLFPSLKRMKTEVLPSFYKKLRDIIIPVLFWGLLLYYPECWVLEKWLPKYSDSLVYLGLLSPMVVYTSIVSLLTNNYLKAYRQERLLLIINVLTFILASFLYGICAYWLKSFTAMLLAVVFIIMLRTIISEFSVMKLIHIEFKTEFIFEFIMTCAFLVSTQCFNRVTGFFFYLVFLVLYSLIRYNNIALLGRQIQFLVMRNNK